APASGKPRVRPPQLQVRAAAVRLGAPSPRHAMARFFVKHVAFLLLTLLVVSFLVFTLNEFSPGAVARKILGAYATQEQVDLLTKQMGLDRPLLVRYGDYLRAAA